MGITREEILADLPYTQWCAWGVLGHHDTGEKVDKELARFGYYVTRPRPAQAGYSHRIVRMGGLKEPPQFSKRQLPSWAEACKCAIEMVLDEYVSPRLKDSSVTLRGNEEGR